MIGIIDYGVGNLRSVHKALERVGATAKILRRPEEAAGAAKLILPGVGAFADGMTLLEERGWSPVVCQWVRADRPLLGICLGMQLLFEGSEEDAPSPGELVPGLGLLPGKVVRFQENRTVTAGQAAAGAQARLKVPHMGWNTLRWQRHDPLLAGLDQGAAVYFVHSYYVQPTEPSADPPSHQPSPLTSATTDYGGSFCATIHRGRLWATQFHPEKSQRVGLRILHNFAGV